MYLCTECAYSECEPQGGENMSAELDSCTSDCAVLLRSRRTKDGGIIREMSLSMRVPIVSPANDG